MTATVSTRPLYLNANTNIYSAWDLRRFMDGDPPGPGVADYESFRVMQRQAGANMTVDVGKTSPGLMQAWVRGSTRDGQGLYRVDNIDVTAPTADTYIAQINDTITANASGNPRLDQVVLEVLDQQHVGASNLAQIRVVAGTPNAAATLDTRTGAAALPATSIRLADVIVANGAVSIVTANIRDRRPRPLFGDLPNANLAANGNTKDVVWMQPHPGAALNKLGECVGQASFDSYQAAALMYLPRRIKGATRIRWRYTQSGVAANTFYNIAICDASGTLIVQKGAGVSAYAGAAGATTNAADTIAATDFEPGWYYVWIGNAPATATTIAYANGVDLSVSNGRGVGSPAPGAGLFAVAGGQTFPAAGNLLGMTDAGAIVTTTTLLTVPIVGLSVG